MLTLTTAAAGKVKELLVEEGWNDIAPRVAVQPGGCSGLRYAMYLDDQVSDKDATEEQHGVRVVIDKMSVPYLSQATVDFIDSLEQTGFTIDNPAAQGGCACSHSFHEGFRPLSAPRWVYPFVSDLDERFLVRIDREGYERTEARAVFVGMEVHGDDLSRD